MASLAPRRIQTLTPQQGRRIDPLAELENQMGNLIRSFFADPFQAITAGPTTPVWAPPVDIEETQDSYLLETDLPGVKPENIGIELRDSNELRISGRYSEREHTGTMRRQSRRTGEFDYDVVLPGDVNAEQIDATLDNGVLTVRARKAQQQGRRIEVKGGGEAGTISGEVTGSRTRVTPGNQPGGSSTA